MVVENVLTTKFSEEISPPVEPPYHTVTQSGELVSIRRMNRRLEGCYSHELSYKYATIEDLAERDGLAAIVRNWSETSVTFHVTKDNRFSLQADVLLSKLPECPEYVCDTIKYFEKYDLTDKFTCKYLVYIRHKFRLGPNE